MIPKATLLPIPGELLPCLAALADLKVFGATPEAVALHLLREGLARELRGDGLLREVSAALMEERESLEAQVAEAFREAGRP